MGWQRGRRGRGAWDELASALFRRGSGARSSPGSVNQSSSCWRSASEMKLSSTTRCALSTRAPSASDGTMQPSSVRLSVTCSSLLSGCQSVSCVRSCRSSSIAAMAAIPLGVLLRRWVLVPGAGAAGLLGRRGGRWRAGGARVRSPARDASLARWAWHSSRLQGVGGASKGGAASSSGTARRAPSFAREARCQSIANTRTTHIPAGSVVPAAPFQAPRQLAASVQRRTCGPATRSRPARSDL